MNHFKVVIASSGDRLETELNLAFEEGYRLSSYRMVNEPTLDGFFYSAILELDKE